MKKPEFGALKIKAIKILGQNQAYITKWILSLPRNFCSQRLKHQQEKKVYTRNGMLKFSMVTSSRKNVWLVWMRLLWPWNTPLRRPTDALISFENSLKTLWNTEKFAFQCSRKICSSVPLENFSHPVQNGNNFKGEIELKLEKERNFNWILKNK